MTVKTKVFSTRGFHTAYSLVAGVEHAENILFLGIVKKIVPNKFASYDFITLTFSADVTLS